MSDQNTTTLLQLFEDFQESGGGAAPYREPGDYTVEVTSIYTHEDTSLAATGRITEGPLAGQAISLGFIINISSAKAYNRARIVLKQFGLPDEFVKAASAADDRAQFLAAVAKALEGRVVKVTVVKDTYRKDEDRNKLADRAKILVVSAPELPPIDGVPTVAMQAAANGAVPPAVVPAPTAAAPAPAAVPAPAAAVPAAQPAPAAAPAAVPAPEPTAAPVAAAPAPAVAAPAVTPPAAPVAQEAAQPAAQPPAVPAAQPAAPAAVPEAVTVDDPSF